MIRNRLHSLMQRLTDNTVFAALLSPLGKALARVRKPKVGRVLSMPDFIALGVLRHVQGMTTLREQVQMLLHLDPDEPEQVPLARSTWSDALSSPARLEVLEEVTPPLVGEATTVLPDRLADIPGLGQRQVRAIDGTYQHESAHYERRTPKQGGEDNPKGHALLTFYNLRLGIPEDVYVDTRSRHEITFLHDYDRDPQALTQQRNVLWLVDRAFVHASFWDAKKRGLGSTVITRMKANLCVDSTEGLPVAEDPVNAGVVSDLRVTLTSSSEPWRLITYRSPKGRVVEFLTNDFDLLPGVVAFLFLCRWEAEKCFDTWKNDFSQAKAWGKSVVAINNQVRLAIITSILVAMSLQQTLGEDGARDDKALRKQDQRQQAKPDSGDGTDRPDWTAPKTLGEDGARDDKALRKQDQRQQAKPDSGDGTDHPDWTAPKTLGEDGARDDKALRRQDQRQQAKPDSGDGTDRPDWTAPIFRYTSKVSRQVLRFFKHCFLRTSLTSALSARATTIIRGLPMTGGGHRCSCVKLRVPQGILGAVDIHRS